MRTSRLAMLVVVLCLSGSAHAGLLDRSDHRRPFVLSLFAGVPYYYGFEGVLPGGVGARFYFPILHNGFVPALNDEFGLEFGADFSLYYVRPTLLYGLSIPIEVLWDFHLHPRFDVYVKVGVALALGFGNAPGFVQPPYYVHPVTAVGLRFHVTQSFYLRAEAGYPWIKLGIGFAF